MTDRGRGSRALSFIVCLALPVSGCLKPAPAQNPAPVRPPAVVQPAPAPPPPPPPPGQEDLDQAFVALNRGETDRAIDKLEAVLDEGSKAPGRGEALFTLALLCARPEDPDRDIPRARSMLEELLSIETSPSRQTAARLILSLLALEEQQTSAIRSIREQMDTTKVESEGLKSSLAQREEELRRIKEILLEKAPGKVKEPR